MNKTDCERFDAKWKVDEQSGCWVWTACRNHMGYGRFGFGRSVELAHRTAWSRWRGTIPSGLCVLHRCDNPPCVNPDHLFLGTRDDNMADAVAKRRMAAGEQHGMAKLSERDVRLIRAKLSAGVLRTDVAREFGVTFSAINDIYSGKAWRYVE